MKHAINKETLIDMLTEKKAVKILDVRKKDAYKADARVIPGAEWHDPQTVETWSDQLPEDRLIVTYCVKGGPVSQSVKDQLSQKGLNTVFLEGGLKSWVEDNHPVQEITPPE